MWCRSRRTVLKAIGHVAGNRDRHFFIGHMIVVKYSTWRKLAGRTLEYTVDIHVNVCIQLLIRAYNININPVLAVSRLYHFGL